ncbi:BTB/POZ fold protein [Cordyceps fumosorosea ARSEF 2679]|uniref:BTB/POZ fold protein n=1 Tax=Cordyceps fumosorosea (strain ARSEF 2679) TaxID=1081104 RepID=A0A167UBF2_CORFA|nr:BTB/POZ fold protein [Cordyceps fumosorosea ARSEF 2679]OAA61414.1 BTB/POZ fold protein [Cordyceps fumosorosea ARSEF 2679]
MAEITLDECLVGPEKKEFFIHASLVTSQPKVLDKLVNGPMREAADGCTVWEHVDTATFVRFGQYVYTGNYEGEASSEETGVERLVKAVTVPDEEPAEAQKQNFSDDYWTGSMVAKCKCNKKKKMAEPLLQLRNRQPTLCAWKPKPLVLVCGVLLSHARVHMMAEYYQVQPLAQLALHKLRQILCKFTLHDERMGDVVGAGGGAGGKYD